ncbi:MAG: selenide, water dikinase SelD [Candidatus Mariimomonas ferrooxydans]
MHKSVDPRVIIGPGDDAGVFRHKNTLLVETVDVITPIVDNPYTFGAICAANSVSDIFAMGGVPLTALAILGFASCDFGPSVIKELLNGAVDKLNEAGACLIGGHSIADNEIKLGFAITGVIDKKIILKAAGAKKGDMLILTKQIGTGILTSAVKLGKLKQTALKPVIKSMLMLNKVASRAAVLAGAKAATDVTGFGLLGHALNVAKSSKVNLVIHNDNVPFMNKMKDFIDLGIVQKGAKNSLDFVTRDVVFPKKFDYTDKMALVDPQTSGGLLVSLPPKGLKKFDLIMKKGGEPYWIMGEIVKGPGKIIIK